ncbi:MAG TPA: hypothetical protein VNA25_15790 [Phycisphaerae bacterium]|nr:hypothetical protein [Phycisphaerae bacterium]
MFPGKTLQEHVQFVREMARLQLWFLWSWLKRHTQEDFAQGLRKRTDVYHRTDLCRRTPSGDCDFGDPRWLELEQAARAVFERTRRDADGSAFERQAVDIFGARLDARSAADYEAGPQLPGYQCGSLKYDPPREDTPDRVFFHIANAVAPRSIFDEPRYLPECFAQLMDRSGAEHGVDRLTTATWLNSDERWLRLFPPEWRENMGPEMTDVGRGMGWWGQFVNARGTLNHKRAQEFRRTGRLHFPPRRSWCSFDAMRRRLRGHLRSLP